MAKEKIRSRFSTASSSKKLPCRKCNKPTKCDGEAIGVTCNRCVSKELNPRSVFLDEDPEIVSPVLEKVLRNSSSSSISNASSSHELPDE